MLDYRSSKRLRAALKLAAVYATGVTLLLVTLVSTTDSPRRVLDALPWYSIPAAICFAIAFLLLAVARRAGFTALWLIAIGIWAWAVLQNFDPFAARTGFLAWTMLAAPLYAMCALGFPRQLATPRWRQWLAIGVWPVWVALVVISLQQHRVLSDYGYMRGQYVGRFETWLLFALLVAPPAITLAGILRVHSRAPTDTTSPAA